MKKTAGHRCRFFNYGLCFSRRHQKLNRTRRWLKEGLPLRTLFTLLPCLNSRHICELNALMKDELHHCIDKHIRGLPGQDVRREAIT